VVGDAVGLKTSLTVVTSHCDERGVQKVNTARSRSTN
jgi:hypothetical protein